MYIYRERPSTEGIHVQLKGTKWKIRRVFLNTSMKTIYNEHIHFIQVVKNYKESYKFNKI